MANERTNTGPRNALSETTHWKSIPDLFAPPMGQGVGLLINDDPVTLVRAWKYGLDEQTLVAKLLERYGSDRTTWFLHLDSAIQDHLLNCMADTDTQALFRQHLICETTHQSQIARYEAVLWTQVYARKPQVAAASAPLEAAALARLRRILL